MGDHAFGQVVGLDSILDGQLFDLGHQPVMAADHPLQQPFMAQPVQPLFLAVPLPARIDQRQITRMAGFQKPLFQRHKQLVRRAVAAIAGGRQDVAILN